MTGFLRDWLLGVTAAALAVALAQALTPQGTVKKVGKIVGGLVLLLAVIRPAVRADLTALLPAGGAGFTQAQAGRGGEEVLKTLIAEKTGAYIVDKGEALGCRVDRAAVTAVTDPSGWPVPWSVEVEGTWTGEQREALSAAIAAELDIPAGRQSFREEGT